MTDHGGNIMETVDKLLDLDLGLLVSPADGENCAKVVASSPMKMGKRLMDIQKTYPNAAIVKIETDEWGMATYYTVKIE